ncbi:MAG TPA: ATP-binding cassette domain-containing protein [Rubrivivax sp.]|nr:ATP-binding cassette domain-containing protein [Rubrivivax sp.]HPO20972.1 ATP-binding cassette domain-containing protein [Rubrivivax sp.]
MSTTDVVIEADGVVTRFGRQTVHDGLSLQIRRGELVALIGGSGSGKSVLLREILGLQRPTAGSVRLLGTDMWRAPPAQLAATRKRFGMMFQEGALFSSLDVAGNVATPLREHTDTPAELLPRLVNLRLALAGLGADAGAKMPAQLSGGMKKRAALARALALEPEVLFLDEPTSGLDPITARAFDELLAFLNCDLGLTVLMVTHDLDTLLSIARRVVVLGRGKVIADGSIDEVLAVDDAWIKSYFSSRHTVQPPPAAAGA